MLLVAGGLSVPRLHAASAESERLSLDGEWRFKLTSAENADAQSAAFEKTDFDANASASGFAPITVPSNWTTAGFEEPHYVNGTTSEGFYVRTFSIPKSAAGKRVLLHFDGVWQSAEVWLNGQRLGRHDSGFTAFAFDATRAIKAGAENRIAVRVRQVTQTAKFDSNDDWALPGIYRSVWMEFTPRDWYIENVETVTDFDDAYTDADLKLRVFVMRDEKADYFVASPPFEVTAILSQRDGKEVQRATVSGTVTNGHNGHDVPVTMHVREPAQWTAETPNLYDLRVELKRDGKLVHAWSDRIGFREVSTTGGVLRVNGHDVKLRGVARHDEHPDVGRATRPQDWRQDIELMKAGNINAVRTSHYPPAEGFIRLCDELGLYVIDEIPYGFGGDRMNDPSLTGGAFLRVQETVARDRNRPSVIVWSLGNEDPFTALHLATLRALKGMDPTRPVLLPFHSETDMPPEADILAPHYRTAVDYDAMAAAVHRPIISTEYSHALGPEDFGGVQQRWDALTSHPTGAGAMIWLWADQGLRRKTNGRPVLDPLRDKSKYTREGSELVRNSDAGPGEIYDAHGNQGTDGIVDADRTPQRDYWELKGVYAPVRVLEDRVDFSPGQPAVALSVRNDFDFLDLSTVGVKWKLFRGADVLASGDAKLSAAPHATAVLNVPTTAIKDAAADGGGVYYVRLAFTRADGSEIAAHSVRLGNTTPRAMAARDAGARPTVTKQGDRVVVTSGTTRYEFDSKTAALASVTIANERVLEGSKLVTWRSSTWSERNQLDKRKSQHDWDTFLQNLTPAIQSWNVAESADGVRITARGEFRENADNVVVADINYLVTPRGTLEVSLMVEPKVDVPRVPEIGFEFACASSSPPSRLTWLGQGPLDSLPNKIAATTFGQWSEDTSNALAFGTKSTLDWASLSFGKGAALRVAGCAGVRLARTSDGKFTFRVLTDLAGAWTKNGPPERPEWLLDLAPGTKLGGSFEITPTAPANR